jgi:hypothetical protein
MKKFAFAAAALVAACGGSSTKYPTITVTAPSANASVKLDATKLVPVQYSTTDFTIKPAGTCGSESTNCGHVHVLIDGALCSAGAPYNNTSYAAPTANADFSKCASSVVYQAHTVTLELHTDGHNAINNASGQPIVAAIAFTVTQ